MAEIHAEPSCDNCNCGGGKNSYLPGFFTAADNYIIKKLMKRASAVHVTAEALF